MLTRHFYRYDVPPAQCELQYLAADDVDPFLYGEEIV